MREHSPPCELSSGLVDADECGFAVRLRDLPLPAAVLDAEGYPLTANSAFMALNPRAARNARRALWLRPILRDDRRHLLRAWADARRAGETFAVQVRLRPGALQAPMWYRLRFRRLHDDAEGWLLLAEEVDDDRRAATGLAETRAELDALASSIGHDLREPLRMITAFIELLARRYGAVHDAQAKHYIEIVRSAADRLGTMLDGMLAFARSGHADTGAAYADVGRVLGDVLANFQGTIAETGAQIVHETPQALPLPYPAAMQLLQNLVGNALKYRSERSPLVRIASEARGELVLLTVADNGRGMGPDDVQRLFRPFARGGNIGGQSGAGVGLAICRRLVERHGGSIACESTPGVGTTFTVKLPR